MMRALLAALALGMALATPAEGAKPPPANAGFDYQIGGDYELPAGVSVVSRDWYIGLAPRGTYAICYVNAFQTQDEEPGVRRRDERSAWPSDLVLGELLGLAVGQKNTVELSRRQARRQIRFDFAIAEECGRWDECEDYRDVHGNRVIAIEYRRADFEKTCAQVGSRISVVLRDVNVTRPGSGSYVYDSC